MYLTNIISAVFLMFFIVGPVFYSCRKSSKTISVDPWELKEIYHMLASEDSSRSSYFVIDSITMFKMKSITLDQSDTVYYIGNSKELTQGVWTAIVFDSARIVSEIVIDSLAKPDPFNMTPPHYSFSMPYFSKDRNSFVIIYNVYCGNLCGEESLRLYKKLNGKWTHTKSFYSSIS